jgi:hypothetical protein
MIQRLTSALLLVVVVVFPSCSPTDNERCEDMDRIIARRATDLPRACEGDIDCIRVQIHEGLTVAANSYQVDPELEELKVRRIELCGDFEADPFIYSAACNEGMCVAVASGTIDDTDVPDSGPRPDADEPVCDCASDSDCSAPSQCVDGCLCTPLCDIACGNAESCDKIAELRLGNDYENCTLRCEADTQSVQGLARARCLASASCSALQACLQ